jgi:TolB-like protein/DNA-binding winged helix-turn-helix (wHTH) protein/tetratricopeptide (TPR) repeat protein
MIVPGPDSPALLSFASFEANLRTGELRKGGTKLRLQGQPFQVLACLLESPGEMVTREDLQKRLWPGETFVDFDTGLNRAVNRIREILSDSAESPRYIETLPRRGYRFIAPVETVGLSAAPPEPAPVVPIPAPPQVPARKLWRPLAAVGILLMIGIAVWNWWTTRDARPQFRSIAVLPLENLSGDPGQEYFADGMTEELITALAKVHSLRVISRTSVMRFKGTRRPLNEIAKALDVDSVAEGSVLQAGGKVRVTAQLLDARQDRHIWADSYERELTDVVALQGQVAKAVAEQIRTTLTPQEDAGFSQKRPMNPEAYRKFLLGRFFFNKRNASSVPKAVGYFEESVAADPSYAPAWASLALAYTSLGTDMEIVPPETVSGKARTAAAKAIAIDDNLAEAHNALAQIKMWFEWDWSGAEREFRRAIDLDPNTPNGAWARRSYSFFLRLSKRFDEAIRENNRAIELDPLDFISRAHLAWIYCDQRRQKECLEQSRSVLEMEPSANAMYLFIGSAYEQQGNHAGALAAFEKAKDGDNLDYLVAKALAWANSGHRDRAEAALRQLQNLSSTRYLSPFAVAEVNAGLGNRDAAFAWLERAYRERAAGMVGLQVSIPLDPLRSDPRFIDLTRRVGFSTR